MSRTVEPLGSGEGRLALVRGLIVTANRDGSVPLNSRVLAQKDSTEAAARQIVDTFNALAEACELAGPALETLMAEVTGKHAADWGKVNDAAMKLRAALALAKGEK